MSNHIFRTPAGDEVRMGYDRALDYVFCTVEQGGEYTYSNLSDPEAGTDCQDVEYFRPILERLGLTVPEALYAQVKTDQKNQAGNSTIDFTGSHGPKT